MNRKVSESEIEKLFFPVRETPVYYYGRKTDYKFIVRADTDEIISCMTKFYKLVPNELVVNSILDSMASQNYTITEARNFSNARMKIELTLNDIELNIQGRRSLPRIIIKNSYDGTQSVSFSAAVLVCICSNGLVVFKNFTKKNYLHWKNKEITMDIGKFVNHAIELINTRAAEMFAPLSRTQVLPKDCKEVISMFPGKMEQPLISAFRTRGNTYWDLLDASTYLISNIMNREKESVHKLEETITGKIISLHRKAIQQLQ